MSESPGTGSVDEHVRIYEQRAVDYAAQAALLRRRDWHLSLARGVVFLVGLALAAGIWVDGRMGWAVGACVVAFVLLAGRHEHMLLNLRALELLSALNKQHQARIARRWRELPIPAVEVPARYQAMARDLNLFGPRSLFQWMCVAHTPMGRETLRDWLLEPATRDVLQRRQAVVEALAPEFDWRESLELHGRLLGEDTQDPRDFVAWATGSRWLASRRWLHVVAWIAPLLMVLLTLAWLSRWIEPASALWSFAALLSLNLLLSLRYTSELYAIFDRVTGRSDQVRHYRSMLELATRVPTAIGPLDVGGRELRQVTAHAQQELQRLQNIVRLLNARRDGLLGLVHLLAQLLCLWNVHLIAWLERWQRRTGTAVPDWFAALGQLEALASLAHVRHDHPAWTFATIDSAAEVMQAEQLGHPLLPDSARVGNDVEVGPPGTFLLVTGSNMSGKSTLLRSLGVNAILAQAGSVVCARRMALPPLIVESSIHVDDSLADGVSFYLAELHRIKQVVDRAHQAHRGGARLLYLLDEILQGTNSRERQVAVVSIIHHLIEQQAIGAVSTHDLELASRGELQAACRVVHFRETLGWDGQRSTMSFDYHLREGVSPTTNALVLLEMVGLARDTAAPPSRDP